MGSALACSRVHTLTTPSVEHRGEQFGAYLAPTLEDLPDLDNVILEHPSADGPFGAKAIGEMANNAQPPAIMSAIHDALGVWVTERQRPGEGPERDPGAEGATARRQAGRLRRRHLDRGRLGKSRQRCRRRRLPTPG
jgi:hypothetical protein